MIEAIPTPKQPPRKTPPKQTLPKPPPIGFLTLPEEYPNIKLKLLGKFRRYAGRVSTLSRYAIRSSRSANAPSTFIRYVATSLPSADGISQTRLRVRRPKPAATIQTC